MSEMDARADGENGRADDVNETSASAESAGTDVEAPDADAAEQRTAVGEEQTASAFRSDFTANFDVDEADVADQQRAVEFDEDDYR